MRTSPTYRKEEQPLTGRPGSDSTPLRKFDISPFGIEPGRFLRELAPSFDDLSWEQYDVKLVQVNALRRRFPCPADRLGRFLSDFYADVWDPKEVQDILHHLPPEERLALRTLRAHRQRSQATFTVVSLCRGCSRVPGPDRYIRTECGSD
jgi:hypothetical protein